MNKVKLKIFLIFITIHNCIQIDCQSNQLFCITGKTIGLDKGRIHLKSSSKVNPGNLNCNILNGKFHFVGTISHPIQVYLSLTKPYNIESKWFFIETGTQNIVIFIKEKKIIVKSNSKIESEFESFSKQIDSIGNEGVSIKSKPEIINQLNLNKAITSIDFNLFDYAKNHTSSYVALNKLWSLVFDHGYKPIYSEILSVLDKTLLLSKQGSEIKDKLEVLRLIQSNSIFPNLVLYTTKYKVNLLYEDLNSDFTLIDFWFSSCPSCIKQFPKMKELLIKYHNKGLQLISISTDIQKYEKEWRNSVKKYKLIWPQYIDKNHLQASILNINYFPTNYLLDRYGKIIYKDIRLERLDSLLPLLMKDK